MCTRFAVFGYVSLFALGCKTTKTATTETTTTTTKTATAKDSIRVETRTVVVRDTVTMKEQITEYAPPIILRDTIIKPVERVIYRETVAGRIVGATGRDSLEAKSREEQGRVETLEPEEVEGVGVPPVWFFLVLGILIVTAPLVTFVLSKKLPL